MALPGFLIIQSVSGIVNVMCLVLTAAFDCVKNIFAIKAKCSGCVLASGWLPISLYYLKVLNIIMG
jgi:hypothetical protein